MCDASTGQDLLTFTGHASSIPDVRFSPDGKHIVSGSYDRTVKVWDAATGKPLLTFRGHPSSVHGVCFT